MLRQSNDHNRLSVCPAMLADGGEQSCNHDHRLWKNISQPRGEGPTQAPWQRQKHLAGSTASTSFSSLCFALLLPMRRTPAAKSASCRKERKDTPRAQDHHTAQHLASIGMKSSLVNLLGVANGLPSHSFGQHITQGWQHKQSQGPYKYATRTPIIPTTTQVRVHPRLQKSQMSPHPPHTSTHHAHPPLAPKEQRFDRVSFIPSGP